MRHLKVLWIVLAVIALRANVYAGRLDYQPPAVFTDVEIRPDAFQTNQTTRFSVTARVVPAEGAQVGGVRAGLAMMSDRMQPLVYDASNNIWTGEVFLPFERLEDGFFLIKATMLTNDKYPKVIEASTNFTVFPHYDVNGRRAMRWAFIMDIVYLGIFLMIATFLKRRVPFFQKFLVPNALIAGFIGLIFGPNVLNLVQFSPERLGNIVYHLMGIGFIAIALQGGEKEKGGDKKGKGQAVNTGAVIVSYYVVQGIVGFAITLIFAYTLFPNLFPPFGMLLPLGYGQGPGNAYSIGSSWESAGFLYGGNLGLTIATFGYLWACFVGVPLMNILLRRGKMKPASSVFGMTVKEERKLTHDLMKDKEGDIPLSESIDRISIQLFLIAVVYFLTFATLFGLDKVFVLIVKAAPGFGRFADTLSKMLWGFHFIFGSIYAMILRRAFKQFKKFKWMSRNYPNDYLLQRISGGAFDFLIAASIAAISIPVFFDNALTILVLTTVGGVATLFYILWISKWVYKKYTLEYILALFGMSTGTISTGLALLKEVDPTFETPVAKDMVFGSGTALGFGLPLMIVLGVPIVGYVEQNPNLYLLTFVLMAVMLGLLLLLIHFNLRAKQLKKNKRKQAKALK